MTDLSNPDAETGRTSEGGVRWEHVNVTYRETIERTVRVHVRAAEPLTSEMIEANQDYLVRLAQSRQHQVGDAYRKHSTTEFVGAESMGSEIAGGGQER